MSPETQLRLPRLIRHIFTVFMLCFPIVALGQSQEVKRFTILHTNDEHAALVPKLQSEYGLPGTSTVGGIARMATLVAQTREEKSQQNEEVLVLSGGDFISGSPFSWLVLADESPELSLMIATGYDVVTLGNHEFDYGPERLASYLRRAGYPAAQQKTAIVASNTVIPDGHELHDAGIMHTHIRTLENGLRIGFFGLMGKHADGVAPMAVPVTFSDQHEAARQMVERLKAEGADVIILLSHSGEDEEADIARAVPEIDIIIGGHTHSIIRQPIRVGSTIIVQTGTEYEFVGKLEMAFNTSDGSLSMLNMPQPGTDETYLIALDDSIEEHSGIQVLLREYEEKLNAMIAEMTNNTVTRYNQVIGRSQYPIVRTPALAETPLGNLVTDAMLKAAEEATGRRVDFVFEASGVIRGDLNPGMHPDNPGAITFYDLVSLIGLGSGPDETPGYPMVSVYFTGEEIRRVLEITVLLSELMGSTYFLQNARLNVEYDPSRALWLRIPFLGTPVPSGKAVLSAKMYTGEGRQSEDPSDYVSLNRGDTQLYHIVSDFYNASFLPRVGEIVPHLGLVMKDENGNPVDLKDRVIYRNDQEAKVWEAVVQYILDQPPGPDGVPVLHARYSETQGRMTKVKGTPILLWPTVIGFGLIVGIILLVRKIRARKKQ